MEGVMVISLITRVAQRLIKRISSAVFGPLNLTLVSKDQESNYRSFLFQNAEWDFNFIASYSISDRKYLLKLIPSSKSQLRQDLFVLHHTDFKNNGYFVEFGATDGKQFNNTFLLEKQFDWKGILAEPARTWHSELKKNRPLATIDTRCVWKISGDLIEFAESPVPELSSIDGIQNQDEHVDARKTSKRYKVRTVSLQNLLESNNAPHDIDYLSIDTEGSEFEILNSFDFSKYNIKIITCEHNYTDNRDKIYDLLSRNGYRRVMEGVSQFDDWFVKN
jgi:FkbM family methyltransferase